MGAMSGIYTDIQVLLEEGKDFDTIAKKLEVPVRWVIDVHTEMLNQSQDSYDCYDTVNS